MLEKMAVHIKARRQQEQMDQERRRNTQKACSRAWSQRMV